MIKYHLTYVRYSNGAYHVFSDGDHVAEFQTWNEADDYCIFGKFPNYIGITNYR